MPGDRMNSRYSQVPARHVIIQVSEVYMNEVRHARSGIVARRRMRGRIRSWRRGPAAEPTRARRKNYFHYARNRFALDALDSYAAAPDDPNRMGPQPGEEDRGISSSEVRTFTHRKRQTSRSTPRAKPIGPAISPECHGTTSTAYGEDP
jgi:hypothetical protein